MKIKQKILLGIILIAMQLFAFNISNAQLDTTLRDHIIILVDVGAHSNKSNVIEALRDVKKICLEKGSLLRNKVLLNSGDYISLLGYGVDHEKFDFDKYFFTENFYANKKERIKYGFENKLYNSEDSALFDNVIDNFKTSKIFTIYTWGLKKTANQLSLKYLTEQKDMKLVNRIFLFNIGKQKIFGYNDLSNYKKELKWFVDHEKIPKSIVDGIEEQIRNTKNEISIDDFNDFSKKYQGSSENAMQLEIHKYIPNESTFEITSVVNIDKNFKFKKSGKGYYYNLTLRHNKDADTQYIIKKFNITLKDKTGKVLIDTIFTQDINDELTIKLELPFETDESKISGNMKFWVHKNYKYFN